jgi:TP901 family phage tail tape measure protein
MAADAESTIRIGIDTTEALASIKNLQAQISAFHTQLQSSGNAANTAISQNLQKGLINNLNATGKFAASLTTVKSSAESFTTALERNKLSMGEYFRFAGASTKTFGRLFKGEFDLIEKVARERVKTLNTQFIKMGRDANGAITAIKVRPLIADLDSLAGKQAIAAQKQQVLNQLLNQGSTNLLNFGKNTQWAGRQLMVGFTVPLAYLGTVAGKTFMKMEEQAIRFKRVYGELFTTSDETDRMVKDIQTLAAEYTKYGVAVEKTMELAADAAAMGKMGADLLAQVSEATRLAVLGNVENEQALATTISLTNAFGTATEELAKKINFLNAVENQTVVSIEDLTIAIPKAGPVVKQLGGDVEDLAFFLTAMKEGGINASEGANALKSGLASLINPTEKASEFMQGFGINLKGIVDSNKGDVKGIVIDFAKALDTLDPLSRARSIEQLFGKFQFARLSTLFQNVIQEGNQASRVLKLTRNTTEELAILSERELKRVEDSTGYKFKKALEDLKASLIPLGEQFLKIVTPIAEFATKALGEFNKLSDGTKGVVTTIVTLLGGVGPIALMAFGLLNNGIANMIKFFAAVRNVILKFSGAATGAGTSISYMTQEQLEASAVAASLNQTHSQLIQTFTLEKVSIDNLTTAYNKAIAAQARFNSTAAISRGPVGKTPTPKKYNSGVLSVPGPKGAGDIIPAMLAPGEAVIPADAATKYRGFIADMIAGKIPGFFRGFLGMPRSGKSTRKNREAATDIYDNFKRSSFKDQEPENYGHQIAPTSGHSFPIFGLGGVYVKPDGSRVFVKPVMDETAAIAEIRATDIARRVHGLEAPEQRIVVIRDPQDPTRQRRFLALESPLNPNLVNNNPVGQFTQEQYFKQLVASLLRADKDLSPSNLFGNVLADVGPAGVFSRASGVRNFTSDLPSMEQQAMINLLGVKGGAKRAFAESTVGLMSRITPQQYHDNMIAEIKRVLPKLKKTIDSYQFSSPDEALAYANMVKRLEAGLDTDWSRFHAIHSAVVPTARKSNEVRGYEDGVLRVPGPRGRGDIVPAMLAPGEAVIPAKAASKYRGFIAAMIAGKIPGFVDGIENFGAAARNKIMGLSEKYANIPEIESILQKTVDRINAEGIKVTTEAQLAAEIKKDSGRLLSLASTTGRVSPLEGSASSMTGLNATHGNAPITVTPEMARALAAQVGEDSGFGKELLSSAATGKNSTAMSNLVFGLPAGFNRQETLMSGTDSASFLKKFPQLFMEPIVKMYGKVIPGLSADQLGITQFTEIVQKKFTALGKKAVTEDIFYAIIKESMDELKRLSPSSPALKALEKARSEFRVIQFAAEEGEKGGRRGSVTKKLAFNARGQIVASSGSQDYRGAASRAAIAGGTAAADGFAEQVLARALKSGTYLPGVEDLVTQRSPGAAAAVAKKEKAKAAKTEKSGARSKSREVKPKKFPGGFDINRVSSVIDSKGNFLYYYLNEDGKKVRIGRVDYTEALGIDPNRLKQIEQAELMSRAQAGAVPEVAPRTTNRFGGRALGIGALAVGGLAGASAMMPQGGQQQEGGIDLMTGAIVASTVASIPMMFGKTIPQVFAPLINIFKNFTPLGKAITVITGALALATPLLSKAFTPLTETEEYAKAFNESLIGGTDGIAKTFGRVSSSDILARRRQDKFTPLNLATGQTPMGDSFVGSEEGKKFVEQYRKVLSSGGSRAAAANLANELSKSVISGVFSAKEAKSIAISVAKELGDLELGVSVSAKISSLVGPNGEKLENNPVQVLTTFVSQSGKSLTEILNSIPRNVLDFYNDRGIKRTSPEDYRPKERTGTDFDGGDEAFIPPAGNPNQDNLFDPERGRNLVGFSAGDIGLFVGSTMSLVDASNEALATFELMYDEKIKIQEAELASAVAAKDAKREAEALAKINDLEEERLLNRAKLQKEISTQMQAVVSIYSSADAKGQKEILEGFATQFKNLYKDSPLSAVADEVAEDLDKLKDQPFSVIFAASLATGDIRPEAMKMLLDGLEGKENEVDVLANVATVIKETGTQSGGELISILNKFNDRSDLQLTITALVKKDQANLDIFSLLNTIPGGGEIMEFYLDPKVNPNHLEDLANLTKNLKDVDVLAKTGDLTMDKFMSLDFDFDESQLDSLKENAEWFDKLPTSQKKVFTSVFLSVLDTIDEEDIDREMKRRASEAGGFGSAYYQAMKNDPDAEGEIQIDLAVERSKRYVEALDLIDGTGTPKTPTDGGKKQASFLDGMVKKVRDLFKATQKLTTGWAASKKALQGLNAELGGNIGKLFGGEGLSEKLRNAGVTESLIPGLMDLRDTDPKRFAELFVGGKISGGLNEFGQLANNIQIARTSVESFAEAQSRSARVSVQSQTAITRLIGLGVSYSDALTMVEDENFAAMVATERFNDEVVRQIGLFNEAKRAAAASAQGMTDEFRTAFDLAMERFAAEEAKIDIKLQLDTEADKAIIEDLQEKIALINDKNDDLDYGLSLIAEQEESINKEYDDRIEALDEVEKANRRISSLQQKQINLAEAISGGDVFAAAKAMQELEAANAEAFVVDRKDMLDREKVAKLEQATAEVMVDGQKKKLTRLEIEELIKKNLKEIAKIEEEQLEPAEIRVRKLTAAAEASKRALEIAGYTKLEWEEVGNQIDLARLEVIAYDGMLVTALGKVNAIVEAWKQVAIEQAKATGQGGASGTGGSTGGDTGLTDDEQQVHSDILGGELSAIQQQIVNAEAYIARMEKAGKTAEVESAGKKLVDYYAQREKVWGELVKIIGEDAANSRLNGIIGSTTASSSTSPTTGGGGGAGSPQQIFASGGSVIGKGTATSDSIPAMLSNGEYVVRASSVSKLGTGFLDYINQNGNIPKFAAGGAVSFQDRMAAAKREDYATVAQTLAKKKAEEERKKLAQQIAAAETARNRKAAEEAARKAAAERARLALVAEKKNLDPAKIKRDTLYQQGGFQGFEAGFQGMMADISNIPLMKMASDYLSDPNSMVARSVLAALSVPVEIMGAKANSIVTMMGQVQGGDLLGAAGTAAKSLFGLDVIDGVSNALSGVIDPTKAKSTMFEQAAQNAINYDLFGAATNPEMAALARIIGGGLNIIGDPLTYFGGIGVARGAAKAGLKVGTNAPTVTTTPVTTRTSTRMDNGEVVDVFDFGPGKKQVVFQGPEQDFSSLTDMGIQVVKPTPQGLLTTAMSNNPLSLNNLKLKSMLNNFNNNVIGKNELNLLDSMAAAVNVGDDGLATLLSGLSGNRAAATQVGLMTNSFADYIDNFTRTGVDLGPVDGPVADPRRVPAIHSTKYPIIRDKDGKIVLKPSGAYDQTNARSSLHWTLGGTVQSHMFGKWDGVNRKIVTPLSSLMQSGRLDNLNPIDTWLLRNPGEALKLDDASVISPFTDVSAYQKELLNRGLIKNDKLLPLIAIDNAAKEVLHILRQDGAYTPVDRIQLKKILGYPVRPGQEAGAIEEAALKLAKQLVETDASTVRIQQWDSSDSVLNTSILNLARQQKVGTGIHMDSRAFRLEGPHAIMGGAYTGGAAPIEALRYAMLRGQLKNPTRPDLTSIMSDDNRLAKGGLVKPKYFNAGGLALGTDIIPSMLTPGEFVMSKYAVQNYGVDKMKALNSGTYNGDSVYNYNLSVNVKSDANPDDIARTVMTQIRQVESQRIRSAR